MKKKHEDTDKKQKEQDLEEIENLKNQLKRSLADYQNLQKRTEDERKDLVKYSNRGLLLRLLPVLDSLNLAKKHIEDEGLNISVRQFESVLKNEGIEEIETKGHEFDPNTMECINIVPGEEGRVAEQLRAGYRLNDKILRPAQVTVGKSNN